MLPATPSPVVRTVSHGLRRKFRNDGRIAADHSVGRSTTSAYRAPSSAASPSSS